MVSCFFVFDFAFIYLLFCHFSCRTGNTMTLAPLVLTLITSSCRACTSCCSYCIHSSPCPCAQNIAMCHILSWHIRWCGELLFSSVIMIIYLWKHVEFTSCQVSCWCDYLSHLIACASCRLLPSSISPFLCARLYWLGWQFPAFVLIFLVCGNWSFSDLPFAGWFGYLALLE